MEKLEQLDASKSNDYFMQLADLIKFEETNIP